MAAEEPLIMTGENMNDSIVKKLKNTKATKDKLVGLLSAEYADNFNYILVAGGPAEANKLFFDLVIFKYGYSTKTYPHVIIGDSAGLEQHGKYSESVGLCKITGIRPNSETRQYNIKSCIRPNTCLVSVSMTCARTGEVRDFLEISKVCKQNKPAVILHFDMSDSIGYTSFKPGKFNITAFTMDFSKLGGPSGISVLAVNRKLVKLYDFPNIEQLVYPGLISAAFYSLQFVIDNRAYIIKSIETLKSDLKEKLTRAFPGISFYEKCAVMPNTLAFSHLPEMKTTAVLFSYSDDQILRVNLNINSTTDDNSKFVRKLTDG